MVSEPLTGGTVGATAAEMSELVRRAKAHDREAFGSLYRLTIKSVYRYLAARVRSVEEAEELTQAVFVAALMNIQTLRAEDEVGLLSWLFQIARHKFADHLRKSYRRPTTQLEDAEQLEDSRTGPGEFAELGEERAALRAALHQLTPEQREVVVCKYVLGYSNDRTARLMGKNVNAVNQLHHRALVSLHRLLTKVGNAE